MIIFNDRKLARHIRDGQLSERQQLSYFIILTLLVAVMGTMNYVQVMADPPRVLSLYEHIIDAAWVAVTLISLLLCYRINARGDGRAFIARYVCLSFPAALRTLLAIVPLSVAGYIFDNPGIVSAADNTPAGDYIVGPGSCFGIGAGLLYYAYRLATAVKIAASGTGETAQRRPWASAPAGPAPASLAASGGHGLRPLLLNIRHGFGAALMRNDAATRMHFSWHALVFVIGAYLLLANIFDYSYAVAPRTFNPYAFAGESSRLMLLMLGAYGACTIFLRGDRTLSFMVALCNMLLLPWFMLALLLTNDSAWAQDADNREAFTMLTAMWIYIASFRLLCVFFGLQAVRAALGAGVIIVALAVPHQYFYIPAFWYEAEAEEAPAPQDHGPTALDRLSHESLFARQQSLVDASLARVPVSAPGTTNIYAVVFGGFAQENVFRREVTFVQDSLAREYGLQGYIVPLLNHAFTADRQPLATASNLDATLKGLAAKMQDEDILLLYMTSHGSAEDGLSITLDYNLRFDRVDAPRIRRALDESGVKNRVVIISACYSGSMIDALKTDSSLIMTASAADRTSFGCSDTSELTYFADALFKQALPVEKDLVKAFALARTHIARREEAEEIEETSNPQIYIGPKIEAALRRYHPPAAPVIRDNNAD